MDEKHWKHVELWDLCGSVVWLCMCCVAPADRSHHTVRDVCVYVYVCVCCVCVCVCLCVFSFGCCEPLLA